MNLSIDPLLSRASLSRKSKMDSTNDAKGEPPFSRPLFWVLSPLAAWILLVICLVGCGPLGLEPSAADSASAKPTPATEGGEEVAVLIEGQSITVADLHQHMQKQFLEELLRKPPAEIYEMHENAVRDLVQRHVIDGAAAERGISSEALFEEITSAAPEPTIQDVTDWFAQNESRLRGARLEDVAGQIRDMLAGEAQSKAWGDFVGPRIAALDWQMKLEPPREQLVATRLIRGPEDAAVTIMTFSDYQCPYCIRSEPVLAEVLARYPETVRVIQRHFPLDSIHPFARPAAEAAMCAEEQGKFWEFHDAIFARQGRLAEGSFAEIGTELELDSEALSTCISERRYADFVQADFMAGQQAGVTGTPAFFINGIPLKGARDADDLSQIVDSELARIQAN
jgi:predicted DsbA family dithiol-disulfide isomerase